MKRAALLLLLATPQAVVAQEAPHIWAVPGVYGLERSACGRVDGTDPAWDGAMVDPIFCPSLDPAHRVTIGRRFAAAMARAFPQVEARFAESMPAGTTARARLAHSLIASLRLTRATRWQVVKPVGVDAFLPITLTLDITNAATGEVVFTRTRSDIAQGTFAPDQVDAGLIAQFDTRLDATLQALVADAAADWKPWQQRATVVAEEGDMWVVDKGRSDGLRTGDSIGSDGRIVYAGGNYAVVKPALGRYQRGDVLTRVTVAPAALLAKPSVLTVMGRLPDGYAAPYLSQVFQDALGTRAGFAPVPVNPGFSNLRSAALGEAQAPATAPRSLPDYIASVDVTALPPARFASNVPGVTIELHEAHAYVSLVDRTGRAVASFHGVGRIRDDVSRGIGFSADQRRDTVVRNALVEAAAAMTRFKPQPLSLPIVSDKGALRIDDTGGALPSGAQLTVLRDVGTVSGVAGRIRVPIGEVTTGELVPGGIAATDAGVGTLTLRGGEMVAVEQVGPPLVSRRTVAQCVSDGRGPILDNRGTIPVELWAAAGPASFAARYRGPVRLADLPARLAVLGAEFGDWANFEPARTRAPDACFVPVVAVTPNATGYDITAGYTLMRGSQKIAGEGLRSALVSTRLPDGTAPAEAAAMLQHDLATHLPAIAEKVAAAVQPTP